MVMMAMFPSSFFFRNLLYDSLRAKSNGRRRGEGILIAGQDRVAFRSVAAPDVEKLITTDPDEVADLARAETEQLVVGEAS